MSLLRNMSTRLAASRPSPSNELPSPVVPSGSLLPPYNGSATFVRDICNDRDRIPDARRVGSRDGYTHVTSLIGLCPRQHRIAVEHEVQVTESVTGGHQVMWAIGRAVEHHVRKQIIAAGRSSVFGRWSCPCGGLVFVGMGEERTCPRCLGHTSEYGEQMLRDDDYRITGSPDIVLVYGDQNVHMPVEIKSMARDLWNDLTEPMGDHVHQVLLYRWLLMRNGFTVSPHAKLVYVAKDFMWGGPYKEFNIDVDALVSARMVDSALDLAAQLVRATTEEELGPRVCATSDCTRARNCPVSTLCFNLRDEPT